MRPYTNGPPLGRRRLWAYITPNRGSNEQYQGRRIKR
jgi:hypothetical protein